MTNPAGPEGAIGAEVRHVDCACRHRSRLRSSGLIAVRGDRVRGFAAQGRAPERQPVAYLYFQLNEAVAKS